MADAGHGLSNVSTAEQAGKRIVSNVKRSEEWMEQYWAEMFGFYRLYRRKEDPNPHEKDLSDFFPPIVHSQITTAVNRLLMAVTATRPNFRLITRSFALRTRVEPIEEILVLQQDRAQAGRALRFQIQNALITALGWKKHSWRTVFDGSGNLLHHHLAHDTVLPFFVRTDPDKPKLCDTWIAHDRVMRKSELMTSATNLGVELKQDDLDNLGTIQAHEDMTARMYKSLGKQAPPDGDEEADPLVKVLEYSNDQHNFWVDYYSERVIAHWPNQYGRKLWTLFAYNPMDGSLVGDSMVDLLSHVQELIKQMERMLINTSLMQTYPTLMVDRDSSVDPNNLSPKVGGIVDYSRSQDGDDPVKPLYKQPTLPDAEKVLSRAQRYTEMATHFNEDTVGMSPERKETAAAVLTRIEEGAKSLYAPITDINDDVITVGVEIDYLLTKKNMIGAEMVTLENRNRKKLSEIIKEFPNAVVDPDQGIEVEVTNEIFEGVEKSMIQFRATGSYGLSLKEAVSESLRDMGSLFKELGIMDDPDVQEEYVERVVGNSEIPGRDGLSNVLKSYYARQRQEQEAAEAAPPAAPPGGSPAMGGPPPMPMPPGVGQ